MAKMIKFNLTLSGATVSTFDELQDNFSADILPIYRTGRLLKWLQARELTEQVQAVQAITPSDDDRELLGALCRAVGLDDDAEVLTFLLEDWQASQQSQTAQTATAPDTTATANSAATSADENEDQEQTHAHSGSTVDWSGQDMTDRNFGGEDFSHGKFVGTDFSNSNLDGVNFSGADLSGAIFGEKCQMKGAKFLRANLTGAIFENGGFNECDFSKADLTDTQFSGKLSSSNFIDAKFNNTKFKSASLDKANFTNVELKNMDFTECKLYMTNFDSADLSFSEFSEESFSNNPLIYEGNIRSAIFNLINENKMYAANFKNSKLTGTRGLTRSEADRLTSVYEENPESELLPLSQNGNH